MKVPLHRRRWVTRVKRNGHKTGQHGGGEAACVRGQLPGAVTGLATALGGLRLARSPAGPNISQSPPPWPVVCGSVYLKRPFKDANSPKVFLSLSKVHSLSVPSFPVRICRNISTSFQLNSLQPLFSPSGAPLIYLFLGE